MLLIPPWASRRLLTRLSDSISAFQNDLKLQGTEDKVIGMTFSDFGRRATSNGSFGTDHGIAAPMFVFGTNIKRQVVGSNPDLVNDLVPLQPTPGVNNQDIKMQIDFRRIYSDILNDWFGTQTSTTDSVLFKNFKTTSLFSNVIETVVIRILAGSEYLVGRMYAGAKGLCQNQSRPCCNVSTKYYSQECSDRCRG